MKRLGLAVTLSLVLGVVAPLETSWAGSFLAVFSGSGLRVVAKGSAVGPVAAGSLVLLSGSPRSGDFGSFRFEGPTYLIVDAHPLEAQVFLDGHLLGTGSQLVARAFPLRPGRHGIEIVAPGFRPYIAQFAVAPGGFPARFRVALSPE